MAERLKVLFWRGLEANRSAVTPDEGVPIFTTDEHKLYIGDGVTSGGLFMGPGAAVAGASLQIQVNEGGAFGGSSRFIYEELLDRVTLISDDALGAVGPELILDRNSASAVAGDSLGDIVFRGADASQNNNDYARINAFIVDAALASEQGGLAFYLSDTGPLVKAFEIQKTSAGLFNAMIGDFLPTVASDGTLHVHASSAGTVAAVAGANTLVVESAGATGVSIISPDASLSSLVFGAPGDALGAQITYQDSTTTMTVGTHITGGLIDFRHGANTAGIQIETDGTLSSSNATYETLITADDDFTTKVYHEGKQTMFISAASMNPTTTNGCGGATQTQLTANQPERIGREFAGTTANQSAQFEFAFPKKWNKGTVTFQPVWTGAAGSGTVEFELQGVALANDNPLQTAYGTAQNSTDTFILANDVHFSPESAAITIAGTPGDDEMVYFRITRDQTTDTNVSPSILLGIKLHWTNNAVQDV